MSSGADSVLTACQQKSKERRPTKISEKGATSLTENEKSCVSIRYSDIHREAGLRALLFGRDLDSSIYGTRMKRLAQKGMSQVQKHG